MSGALTAQSLIAAGSALFGAALLLATWLFEQWRVRAGVSGGAARIGRPAWVRLAGALALTALAGVAAYVEYWRTTLWIAFALAGAAWVVAGRTRE